MNMTCPACKVLEKDPPALVSSELEPELNAKRCEKCEGVFLDYDAYERWLRASAGGTGSGGAVADEDKYLKPSKEVKGAKFCPHCSTYLVKYDVGAEVNFTVDRCGKCGGIWLDGNEWNQLKARSLHRELHNVFSTNWQSNIRMEEHAKALEAIWKEQFGSDYDELIRVKKWIEAHPKSAEMYAFLRPEYKGRQYSYTSDR